MVNPYLTNGFSHHYQLGESTFILWVLGVFFIFLSHFSMKFLCANRIAPDGLYCLPMSHKRDARLIRVNEKRDVQYRGFSYLCLFSDALDLAKWIQSEKL